MTRKVIFLATLLLAFTAVSASAAWLDPSLETVLKTAAADEDINVFIVLKQQVDLEALVAEVEDENYSLARRHFEVITRLQDLADETQPELLKALQAAKANKQVSKIKAFWITNAIAVTLKPAFISKLMERPEIKTIFLDYPIELIEPVAVGEPMSADTGEGIENGITVTRAPELWAMGIDGTGTLACDQDTGADGNHPAFASRWRGLDPGVTPAEAWFDPLYNQTFPTDSGSHGTHTLGTILGSDGANQIGMAPGAKWIGAKTIDTGGDIFSDAVGGFEWSADPDGDPGTTDDVPDVISNSWGIPAGYPGYSACLDDFNASILAAEAAGVVVVFAAGNEGPSASTLRPPADNIMSELTSFSTAALNQDGETAASFSSRGPSKCDYSTIKPEISAVGVDVRSSIPGGSYTTMSGTSMACPHVAGAVLLLRQAFPDATPEQVKSALYFSAVDLGTAGEDNTYGMGRIDLVEAYLWLLVEMVNSDGKIRFDEDVYNCSDSIEITVSDIDLESGTINVTIVSDTETSPETVTLTLTDNDGVYKGTIGTTGAAPADANGVLSVSDSDTITATYIDADDGNGNFNVIKTIEATTDCIAPTFAGLTDAVPDDNFVTLTWNPATDVNPVTYNVYRSDTSMGYDFDEPLATTSSSPYVDDEVVNNETWYYVVRAKDSLGNEDTNTVEFSATPVGPVRLFQDDFDGLSSVYADWTVVNAGTCQYTWKEDTCYTWDDWCENTIVYVEVSDCFPFTVMDEELITPAIDTRGFADIELRFSHLFDQSGGQKGDVEYSLNGTDWTLIEQYKFQSYEGQEVFELPELNQKPHVYFRFHFYNAGLTANAWGIDDVEVTGWQEPYDDDTTDDDTVDDDTVDDDTSDDDTSDDDTSDDDTGDDDTDDDTSDDDTSDDDTSDDDTDDDVTDDDVNDDDLGDDDTAPIDDDDDDDDDDDGCGC